MLFIAGLIFGLFSGIVIVTLCVSSKNSDLENEILVLKDENVMLKKTMEKE